MSKKYKNWDFRSPNVRHRWPPTSQQPAANQISVEKAAEGAAICLMNNVAAALTQLQEDETLRLVQMQGFVQSAEGFHEQPAVLNGASELAVKIFGENGKHARTAVGVSNLPKNVAVEISCTFQVIKAEAKFTGRYGWIEGSV